jgi:hypothetical protein
MSNSKIFDIKCWCKFQIINSEGFFAKVQNRIFCQASGKKCELTIFDFDIFLKQKYHFFIFDF